jgi:GNAT superfamily N-acetyltransferase
VEEDFSFYLRLLPELGVEDPPPDAARFAAELAPRGLVLEDEGGAEIGWTHGEIIGDAGYVRNVIVDPAARRRGAGRALMQAIGERMRAGGCRTWRLNVKSDNTAAIALYHAFGMATAYRAAALKIAWEAVERLPGSARSVEGRVIRPEEDAALEAAFRLLAGQLAGLRALGHVLMRLCDRDRLDDAKVGVARFNPAYPGIYPFRVGEPALARALLEALRPHARPGDREVGLVIEDDDATVAVVRAAGAALKFEMLHMQGPL